MKKGDKGYVSMSPTIPLIEAEVISVSPITGSIQVLLQGSFGIWKKGDKTLVKPHEWKWSNA